MCSLQLTAHLPNSLHCSIVSFTMKGFRGILFLFLINIALKCQCETAAFWHIYGHQRVNHTNILLDQWRVMSSSGLVDSLDKIYYLTLGTATSISSWHDKLSHLGHYSTGSEILTLKHVHEYCATNVDSKVLYFHNKGSFNPGGINFVFRQALDCYNLNPHCIRALDTYDTCGMRFSPIPHMHYSGNYFWATCEHISKLIDPGIMEGNATFRKRSVQLSGNRPSYCLGTGRYFAETWVTSLPHFAPSDCMQSVGSLRYLYGRWMDVGMYKEFCPNVGHTQTDYPWTRAIGEEYVKYGESCADVQIAANPHMGYSKVVKGVANKTDGCVSIHAFVKRSYLWYGSSPSLYLKLMRNSLGPTRWIPYQIYDDFFRNNGNSNESRGDFSR